jgi:osmoprotectant transport system ATP-binding protein
MARHLGDCKGPSPTLRGGYQDWMLRFAGLHIALGGQEVLHGIDLQVDAGTRVALVGPSGSGKSTLLRAALGLVAPTRGTVWFAGRPVVPGAREHRVHIGTVIQEGGLFPHLTARGNAALMASHLGWPRPRIEARLNELLALTRLDASLLERYPTELSGGQRQRVALIRALMLSPKLLLLDEPLGALDPVVRGELQEELLAIFRAVGTTVVIVTHDLPEAVFFADRVAVLEGGRLVAAGTVDEIRAEPSASFAGRFLGGR